MYQPSNTITPFLEKISRVNFDKYYTPGVKILCHAFMWIFFSSLLFMNYWVELKLSFDSSFLLTARGTVNNMVVFYIFFYIIVPKIFKSNVLGVFLVLICLPICIYIWLSVNYLQFVGMNYFGIEINSGPLQNIVSRNAKQTIAEALSFKNVFGNAMLVIYSFSPPFFVKMLFDITRLFNRTIYFQKQTSELELQNLNIEKDFLKAQLNPHFLFNTLNNLYGLVVKKDPSAPEAIINISDLMAYTLYESNTEQVPLEKELDFIRNYFALEKMRYSADKEIELNISAPEDLQQVMIAPLLTFTFIENGFKYGLKSSDRNFLIININFVKNIFYFSIENNKDTNIHKNSPFGGIGVKNVEKRLNLLYPANHSLKIEDRENSFFVSLSINLT